MGQIWDFLRSASVRFCSVSQNVLNIILKSPTLVPFGANLSQYGLSKTTFQKLKIFDKPKYTKILFEKSIRFIQCGINMTHFEPKYDNCRLEEYACYLIPNISRLFTLVSIRYLAYKGSLFQKLY